MGVCAVAMPSFRKRVPLHLLSTGAVPSRAGSLDYKTFIFCFFFFSNAPRAVHRDINLLALSLATRAMPELVCALSLYRLRLWQPLCFVALKQVTTNKHYAAIPSVTSQQTKISTDSTWIYLCTSSLKTRNSPVRKNHLIPRVSFDL